MQPRFLGKRVEILEQNVDGLSDLPNRTANVEGRMDTVESQFVQLRMEMHAEFSAVREEIRKGDEETRTFMRVLNEETRADVRKLAEGLDDTRQELFAFRNDTAAAFKTITARLDGISGQLTRTGRRKTR